MVIDVENNLWRPKPLADVRKILFVGPEKCLKVFKSSVGVVSKRWFCQNRFGPLHFPFENYDHVSKDDFGPLSEGK